MTAPDQLRMPVLEHALVRLEPLSTEHVPGLALAAAGPRDGFRFAKVPSPEGMPQAVAAELDRADYWPFAQLAGGRVVGHTGYLSPRRWPDGRLLAIEIGSTWLAPEVWGTGVNPAAKLLLLDHAFDRLGVERVDIKTDARNERSRAAIRALGASFEGVLRSWQPSAVAGEEHLVRDTAMHSIVRADWPSLRPALLARIATLMR